MGRRKLMIALLLVWPHVALAQSGSPAVLYETGVGLYDEGKYLEAEPVLRDAVERGRHELAPGSVKLQRMLNTLGTLYYFQGRFSEAEPLLKQAVAIGEGAVGPVRPETIISLSQLANVYRTRGPRDEAEPLLRRAIDLAEKDLAPGHPVLAVPLHLLAVALSDQKRCREARPLAERAVSLADDARVSLVDRAKPHVAKVYHIYACRGLYPDAPSLIGDETETIDELLPDEHPSLVYALLREGLVYHQQERYADAELRLLRAKSIAETGFEPTVSTYEVVRKALRKVYVDGAAAYDRAGRRAEAEEFREKLRSTDEE